MSVALKQAAVDEALALSNLFRQNAALKHGLPAVDRISAKLPDVPDQLIIPVTNTVEKTIETSSELVKDSPSPGLGAAPSGSNKSLASKVAPLFLYTSAALAGAGGLSVLNSFFNSPEVTPSTQEMSVPPFQDPKQVKEGSLLQHLEDRGYHLPGGEQWQTK